MLKRQYPSVSKDLGEMMRMVLKAVDYAFQVHILPPSNLAVYLQSERYRINLLHGSVMAVCRNAERNGAIPSDLRSLISACGRMAQALSSMWEHALDLTALYSDGAKPFGPDLRSRGRVIVRSLRLCIIGFVNNQLAYVREAVQCIDAGIRLPGEQQGFPACAASEPTSRSECAVALHLDHIESGARAVAMQLTTVLAASKAATCG